LPQPTHRHFGTAASAACSKLCRQRHSACLAQRCSFNDSDAAKRRRRFAAPDRQPQSRVMTQTIQEIFVDPPIAIARLGGSSAPQDAYRWVESNNPRSDGNTVIAPWWTFEVLSDGTVDPRMPDSVRLRDGDLIRPVAPFFEIWALLGEPGSARSQWREAPLTPKLLRQYGADVSALTLQIDAKNRKAARRMVNADLVFGTFPPSSVRGDDHAVHTLLATSPPEAAIPMIPRGRNIPLGSIQITRSREQPRGTGVPWEGEVRVDVVRFRFTPARGHFYGPPQAAQQTERHGIAVEKGNGFLDAKAGWFDQRSKDTVEPIDTYDTLIPETGRVDNQPSLGVVDDTCEARVTATLALPGKGPLTAHANIFVGPPDFAPDRRPFLSLADELQDRGSGTAERNAALKKADRETWVRDLFERIYETVSLFNADHFQDDRSILLKGRRLRTKAIRGDHVSEPRDHAMTNKDRLRNDAYTVAARSPIEPLPLSEHARTRHLSMQDTDALRELIAENPDRLQKLVRQPFEVEEGETAQQTTMRMPPFMRNSNANPLTLSFWQYDLLMQWVKSVPTPKVSRFAAAARQMSPRAKAHKDAVLARLNRKPR
jgi:hypothetical protein